MKISRALMLALLVMLAQNVAAQQTRFVSSRHSPLKQNGVIQPNEVVFSGKAQVVGSLEVVWEPGTESAPGYFRAVLRPDKASLEILPHDSERGPAREIWLRNTDLAIRSFLSPTQRKALMSSRSRHATGRIAVIISSYHTGVDCDQRGYNALLVSVVHRPSNVVAGAPAHKSASGC